MEEHLLLRVPDELKERLNGVMQSTGGVEGEGGQVDMSYECISTNGRDFVFSIEGDKYYATLQDLPCILETHKTLDNCCFYKSSEIGQVLQVHNRVSQGKPESVSTELDDGVAPPLAGIRARYKKLAKKSFAEDGDPNILEKVDRELVDIEADLVKRERSADEHAKPYVYEELIEEEPYMHYWDDVTVIEMGSDNFLSSAKESYDKAYARYEQRDKTDAAKSMKKPKPKTKGKARPAIALLDEKGRLRENNVVIEKNVRFKKATTKQPRFIPQEATSSKVPSASTSPLSPTRRPSPTPLSDAQKTQPAAVTSHQPEAKVTPPQPTQPESVTIEAEAERPTPSPVPTETGESEGPELSGEATPSPSPPAPSPPPEELEASNKERDEAKKKVKELEDRNTEMQDNLDKLATEIQAMKNKMLAKRKEKVLEAKKKEQSELQKELDTWKAKLQELES